MLLAPSVREARDDMVACLGITWTTLLLGRQTRESFLHDVTNVFLGLELGSAGPVLAIYLVDVSPARYGKAQSYPASYGNILRVEWTVR